MNRAGVPQLDKYRLVGRSVTTTVSGVFLDSYGRRTGSFFSGSVTSAAFSTLASLYGSAIPGNAVGCILSQTSADLVVTTEDEQGGEPDLATAKLYAPWHDAATRNIALGVVAS